VLQVGSGDTDFHRRQFESRSITRRCLTTPEGNRTGEAREAADWVSYANDPDNKERKQNGAAEPFNLKVWQLSNETSYGGNRTFTLDSKRQAATRRPPSNRQSP
jgi:alpha-L-arabinofuranosidase